MFLDERTDIYLFESEHGLLVGTDARNPHARNNPSFCQFVDEWQTAFE